MFDNFEKVEDKLQEYCDIKMAQKGCEDCKFKELCDAIDEIVNEEKYPFKEGEYYGCGGYL